MNVSLRSAAGWALAAGLAVAAVQAGAADDLKLTGDQEVPPVMVAGTGSGSITVASDGSVSGSITTSGIAGTMAHIHLGAVGTNGAVIIPLTSSAVNVWSVPAGARLNNDQMAAYRAGGLYVNVHSDAHKGGEIRAQMLP